MFGIGSACLVLAFASAATHPLTLEPPFDPLGGAFTAVAYWQGASCPDTASFALVDADGAAVWSGETPFDPDTRRAACIADIAGVADGIYALRVTAGEASDAVEVAVRQGRTQLPDERPFRDHMIWMPMTGWTEAQFDDARAAGYDTVFCKLAPPYAAPDAPIDFGKTDEMLRAAQARGMKVLLAMLLWTGLPPGQFYVACHDGTRVPDRIEPMWAEAWDAARAWAARLHDHYMGCPDIIAFAPTWGIYGEAGYVRIDAGYGPHALKAFNQWRLSRGEPALDRLPDPAPTYDNLLFHRFRFERLAGLHGELVAGLQHRDPNGTAIGAWQEIYNIHNYRLALAEAPGARFAINEMCFPFVTTYDQRRAIGETMGVRYLCDGFEDYRDYYRPLAARRWAEGQQAIGCQLSNHYAEANYSAWPAGRAEEVGFEQWEDRFADTIRRIKAVEPVDEPADVAYVQMTYPAAVYPDVGNTGNDANFMEIVLRMHGIAYDRVPFTHLSRLTAADLGKYKCVVVPCAWYLDEAMWRKLVASGATVLLTGGVMQASDDGLRAEGESRAIDGLRFTYGRTAGGTPEIAPGCPPGIADGLDLAAWDAPFTLPEDVGLSAIDGAEPLIRIGGQPLLARRDRLYFIANRLLFACAHDPDRTPPEMGGSADKSADYVDIYGTASSTSPANPWGERLIRNILREAGARIRISEPPARIFNRFLGDHCEAVNVTGSIVVNQDAQERAVSVLCRFPTRNVPYSRVEDGYLAQVVVPAYDFVALEYAR